MSTYHPIEPAGYNRLMRALAVAPDPPEEGVLFPAGYGTASRVGKYLILREIAQGGMGVVHEADDPVLKRRVALKFLKGRDKEEVERFRREAQTAGSLGHPNIAAIYETGEEAGQHFIAMQYVEGQTLAVFPRRDRKLLARFVRDAARALAYAHERDIVHRDIKPENLMVTADHHLYVMDFGLARTIEGGSKLSLSGTVVGTPNYMSPEQARGKRVDGRADIYALGATLYELLTDRVPFKGANVYETLKKVEETDLTPPRRIDPKIDADLETIALKCLEKDPERRYATAGELADDLDRFLQGEAVRARPASLVYRLRKKLVKRKALAATVGVALVVVGIVLAVLDRTQAQLSETTREMILHMRITTDACLDAALARRREGDLPGMRKHAEQVGKICQAVILKAPHLAEPHYRLGRIHRALMNDEAALAEQREALGKDPRYAPAIYEKVVLQARAYRLRQGKVMEEALRKEGEHFYEARKARGAVAGAHHCPSCKFRKDDLLKEDAKAADILRVMKADLDLLESAAGEIGAAEKACARGILALAQGDKDRAGEQLRQAVALSPILEEAYENLFALEKRRGNLEAAVQWLGEGLARDRGYVPYLELRAELSRSDLADERARAGKDPVPLYESAIADLGESMRLAGERSETLRWRGAAHKNLGYHRRSLGQDPTSHFDAAIRDLDKAVRLDPGDAWAWGHRAMTRVHMGNQARDAGSDPVALYEQAERDSSEALRRDPDIWFAYFYRGQAHSHIGDELSKRGADPSSSYEKALRDFDEFLKRNPRDGLVWCNRNLTLVSWAGWRRDRGGDPTELFRSAVRDTAKVPSFESHAEDAGYSTGLARREWGEYRHARGEDPRELYEAAINDFTKAIEAAPGDEEAWGQRGLTRVAWARYLNERKESDPTGQYEAAIEDFSEAIKAGSGEKEHWVHRGLARADLGSFLERARPAESKAQFAQAIVDFGEALARDPKSREAWHNRGYVRMRTGDLDGAIQDLSQALAVDPAYLKALRNRALAHRRKGDYGKALEDLDKALDLDPASHETWFYRARLFETRGDAAEAEKAYRKALDLAPPGWPDRDSVTNGLKRVQRVKEY